MYALFEDDQEFLTSGEYVFGITEQRTVLEKQQELRRQFALRHAKLEQEIAEMKARHRQADEDFEARMADPDYRARVIVGTSFLDEDKQRDTELRARLAETKRRVESGPIMQRYYRRIEQQRIEQKAAEENSANTKKVSAESEQRGDNGLDSELQLTQHCELAENNATDTQQQEEMDGHGKVSAESEHEAAEHGAHSKNAQLEKVHSGETALQDDGSDSEGFVEGEVFHFLGISCAKVGPHFNGPGEPSADFHVIYDSGFEDERASGAHRALQQQLPQPHPEHRGADLTCGEVVEPHFNGPGEQRAGLDSPYDSNFEYEDEEEHGGAVLKIPKPKELEQDAGFGGDIFHQTQSCCWRGGDEIATAPLGGGGGGEQPAHNQKHLDLKDARSGAGVFNWDPGDLRESAEAMEYEVIVHNCDPGEPSELPKAWSFEGDDKKNARFGSESHVWDPGDYDNFNKAAGCEIAFHWDPGGVYDYEKDERPFVWSLLARGPQPCTFGPKATARRGGGQVSARSTLDTADLATSRYLDEFAGVEQYRHDYETDEGLIVRNLLARGPQTSNSGQGLRRGEAAGQVSASSTLDAADLATPRYLVEFADMKLYAHNCEKKVKVKHESTKAKSEQ